MANKDLVVKMTIDSKDFNGNLQNAKKNMRNFTNDAGRMGSSFKTIIGGMTKAFGALGIAVGGAQLFKSLIGSTQTFGDKWNNAMVTAKTSFHVFEMAVVNGNTNILNNFRKSIAAAHEFAVAMDSLGSAQISNQYARMNYVTPFNEAMTKYREAKNSGNKTGMAFAASDMNRMLNAYSENAANLMNSSLEAATKLLSSYTGGYINSGNVRKYLDQLYLELVNGVLPEAAKELKKAKSTGSFSDQAKAIIAFTDKYGHDVMKESSVLLQLADINDETLKELLGILQTYDGVRNEINSMHRQMVRVMGSSGSSGGGGGTKVSSTAASTGTHGTMALIPGLPALGDDTLARMDALGRKLTYTYDLERMNAEMALEWQMHIDKINSYAIGINGLAEAFTALGGAMGDTPFAAFANILGGVGQQIAGLISTYTSLIAVESVAESLKAGNGIPFPFNLALIGAAGTAIAGIISTISSQTKSAGKYTNGGIVPGNSYSGDKLWARVNSGEMILNRSQQAALFGSGRDVHFVIEGSQLQGVLDNYSKTLNL